MLRNHGKIQHGSHWLQWFLEFRLLQKTAMLLTSRKREVDLSIDRDKARIERVQHRAACYIHNTYSSYSSITAAVLDLMVVRD